MEFIKKLFQTFIFKKNNNFERPLLRSFFSNIFLSRLDYIFKIFFFNIRIIEYLGLINIILKL